MATRLEFKVLVPETITEREKNRVEEILAGVFNYCEAIEDALTEYRAHSPVYRLNHAAGGEWIPVNEHAVYLLGQCDAFYQKTGGSFDPGFRGNCSVPFSKRWELSADRSQIRRLSTEFLLGFGAIGKGYAVDLMASRMAAELPFPFVINFGGSSLYFSEKTFGTDLGRMGWAWDRDESGDFIGVELNPKKPGPRAVGVSGTVEKGSHIHARGVCQPNGTSVLSTFVSGKRALQCDAFSTALFVLGWEEGYSKGNALVAEGAFSLVTKDRIPHWNKEFSEQWMVPWD